MPSPVAHCIVGTLSYIAFKKDLKINPIHLAGYLFAANLPDIDFLWVTENGVVFSNQYHHGWTHSLTFSIAIFLSIYFLFRFAGKHVRFSLLIALISHGILDLLSYDDVGVNGYGIQLLWPFSSQFVLFPFPLFFGPDTSNLFKVSSWSGVINDFALLIPLGVVWLLRSGFRKEQKNI